MHFPDIPNEVSAPAKDYLNFLRQKYEWYMFSSRCSPLLKDDFLRRAGGIAEQAERILKAAQAQSSRTADPDTFAGDD